MLLFIKHILFDLGNFLHFLEILIKYKNMLGF